MDDAQIIALYFARDERAIEQTAARYGNYCFQIAHNILENRSDAEEVVNDTYMGAWRSIPPHKPMKLRTYLGKIARRLSLMKYRNYSAEKRGGGEIALALEELGECIPDSDRPERQVEMRELSMCIKAFIGSLPEIEQAVFVGRYWYLYSIKTIAGHYGFSQSKVKSMLSRTRDKLHRQLQKEGFCP